MDRKDFLNYLVNDAKNNDYGVINLSGVKELQKKGFGFRGTAKHNDNECKFYLSIRPQQLLDSGKLICTVKLGNSSIALLSNTFLGELSTPLSKTVDIDDISFEAAPTISFPRRNYRINGFDQEKYVKELSDIYGEEITPWCEDVTLELRVDDPEADAVPKIVSLLKSVILATWFEGLSTTGTAKLDKTKHRLVDLSQISSEQNKLGDLASDTVTTSLAQKGLYFDEDVINDCVTALKAGHNIILSGAPGCGKSILAAELTKHLGMNPVSCTATTSWTSDDLVGRYLPHPSGQGLSFIPGFFLKSIAGNVLMIDEINRCDLDACFGELFTILADKTRTQAQHLPFCEPGRDGNPSKDVVVAGEDFEKDTLRDENVRLYSISKDFRIIGTMNSFDRSRLHQFSAALSRRFSVIVVGKPTQHANVLAETFSQGIGGRQYNGTINLALKKLLESNIEFLSPALVEGMAEVCRTIRNGAPGTGTTSDARENLLRAFSLVAGNQLDIVAESALSRDSDKIVNVLLALLDSTDFEDNPWNNFIEKLSDLPNLSEHRNAIRTAFLDNE